jgi:hypothetical protein
MVLDLVVADNNAIASGLWSDVAGTVVQQHAVDAMGKAIGMMHVGLSGDNVRPMVALGKVLRDGLVQMVFDQFAILLPKGLLCRNSGTR